MGIIDDVSLDAWVSGLGSFLGALIAGVLAALISIYIFVKSRKEDIARENEKRNSVNASIGLIYENITFHLLEFVSTIYSEDEEFKMRKKYRIKEFQLLVEGINELDSIYPLDIPEKSVESFLNNKHLLKILKYDLEGIIYNEELDVQESYTRIIVVTRFLKVIENLIEIYSDGFHNKETLQQLKEEFKELEKIRIAQSQE